MVYVQLNEQVCISCGLCRVHCAVQHSRSRDLLKAFKSETPRPSARLRLDASGPVSLAIPCRHCIEPWCVYSCLTGALSRDVATGNVSHDPKKCIGCWTCVLSCPYGAIFPDPATGKVMKCDLCPGRETPACVENCPNEALSYHILEAGNGL
ncbi:MAG: 4Fe-4S dicluster domain-containing protein [Chloroflexota bacterium]